ncbi:SAGA complex subunit Sgf73 [Coemansia furcata]|nr:SAGA complex subunit Sgf73 [Coemansia furcata]
MCCLGRGWYVDPIDVEKLREERIEQTARRLGINKIASMNVLSLFGRESDWQVVASSAAERMGAGAGQLAWDLIKKAVGEEDKYQSKKNWSSTKGRGNRKPPIARRLDADSIKKFGVYPMQQYPTLSICDSCGRQVNAHFLKEHQETLCVVSAVKREDKRTAAARAREKEESPAKDVMGKRLASEALSEDEGGRPHKVSKRDQLRVEKEQREREKAERREQLRAEKERRKREKDEKKERELVLARTPLDLDKQCGFVGPEPGSLPCTRSLTCKTHSMAMKRSVRGRTKLFDALLQAHLAKSRSAAAAKNAASNAKSSNAAAVRNATAIALGGGEGALDESFFEEESDGELGSDAEAEMVIGGIRCSRGRPMAARPTLLPRRRHRYLRVRDLFYDALKPSMGGETADALAS